MLYSLIPNEKLQIGKFYPKNIKIKCCLCFSVCQYIPDLMFNPVSP